MSSIKLNENELDALQQLTWSGHPFAALLYVLQFRRRMDFVTRRIGDTPMSTVNQVFLMNTLERQAVAGSHHGTKKRSRDFIQREITWLIKVGLLERLPKKNNVAGMRFFLPLADTGLIRSQEERTMSALDGTHYKNKCAHSGEIPDNTRPVPVRSPVDNSEGANQNLSQESFTSALIQDTGLYPKSIHDSNARANENGVRRGDGFLIPLDWWPDEKTEKFIREGWLTSDDELEWHVVAFRLYWIERAESRSNWNEVLTKFTRQYGLTR